MSMYGDDYQYADSRLRGSIVMFEGVPVLVRVVGMGMVAEVSLLSTIDEMKSIDAHLLDVKPVLLGYVNHRSHASYLMRKPMRRDYKQGLRYENFLSIGDVAHTSIHHKKLGEVIEGKYPSYADCLKAINKGTAKSMAWCREWAISGDGLHHKGVVVGVLVDGRYELTPTFTYLKESLEEQL
jgi:hypothetical protein